MAKKVKSRSLAVLTGGGDAQGMNAALRAVSRMAISTGWTVYGIRDGFHGLWRLSKAKNPFSSSGGTQRVVDKMNWEYMSWAIRDGGSLLGTIRYPNLKNDFALQRTIVRKLTDKINPNTKKEGGLGVSALIVIGGNGSLQGAQTLASVALDMGKQLSVVVVPASIDNDIPGTEISIGVDTALNTIVESIDKLVDTTSAVNRAIVVETMGRDCSYLAILAALASGADEVFYRERPPDADSLRRLSANLTREYAHGRRTAVIVVGEGASARGMQGSEIVKSILTLERTEVHGGGIPWDVRKCELGHLQRGGPTSAFDRILGTRMGARAVELVSGKNVLKTPQMVTLHAGDIGSISLERVADMLAKGETATSNKVLDNYKNLVQALSRLPSRKRTKGRLVILAGGPDAPGMNTVLHAVSRFALNQYGLETWGAKNGFAGLIENELVPLAWHSVVSIALRFRRAGCILRSSRRSVEFSLDDKRKILETLRKPGLPRGLILLGGLDTAIRGRELAEYFRQQKCRIPIVYIPASIDHGLPATHATVGFDTALNVVVAACDNVTDTAQATDRVNMVDTMGGGVGALTLMAALAAGAECAILAEELRDPVGPTFMHVPLSQATLKLKQLHDDMRKHNRKYATILFQKSQFLELDDHRLLGRADEIFSPSEVRETELGYTQRGGNASYYDRMLGTIMGVEAVEVIMKNGKQSARLLRQTRKHVDSVDLASALKNRGGKPWSERTRMPNAMPLWRFKEIWDLFEKISFYGSGRS